MKTGAELIADERQRQISVEGYTPDNDDKYNDDELVLAGVSYALADRHRRFNNGTTFPPVGWKWLEEFWKPTPDDRIKELVKAGALIAAEIDRVARLKTKDE